MLLDGITLLSSNPPYPLLSPILPPSILHALEQIVKRVRLLKVQACVLDYLRRQMPLLPIGREAKQKDLIKNIAGVFDTVREVSEKGSIISCLTIFCVSVVD